MTQRPTGEEAKARRDQSLAVYEAVSRVLYQNSLRAGHKPQMFFATLPAKFAKAEHPVLGPVDPTTVLGLETDNLALAELWAKHWLGMRGYGEVISLSTLVEHSDKYPGGCPVKWTVPAARFFAHPQGGQIIVWANGEMDAYSAEGKRKQTSATPEKLEEGHGAWREVFYSFDGEALTQQQVHEICLDQGVY